MDFWLTYARQPKSYEGPQLSLYRKLAGLWMTGAILEAVGPAALTNDESWGSPGGFLEGQARNGIVKSFRHRWFHLGPSFRKRVRHAHCEFLFTAC